MTMSDLTPSFVSTLKGQALRDAWERVFGRPTQSKDAAAQRKQINEELARRAKGEEQAPAAPPSAEKPSLAAQAKAAEEAGNWLLASTLWTAAAGAAKNGKLTAKFAGNAAAAKVRAEGQPKPAPVLDLPAAQSSGEPVVPAAEVDAIDEALAAEPTQDDINSAPVDEAAAEAEGDKPVEPPAVAPVTTLAAPKKPQLDHDGRRLPPRAKKPSKATEAEERLSGARVMARALCSNLDLRVSVDGDGRWIEPTLEQVENMDVPDGKRADWIKLQTQLQIIESAKPARAPKAAKAPKPEKVQAAKPEAPAKATEADLKALLAAGQPVDATAFRHLMPVHLKYGKNAKGHTYAPSIVEGAIKWTRTDKAERAPKAAKLAKEPKPAGELKTSSAADMLAGLKDGQVLKHGFKDGRPAIEVTVHRNAEGKLSYTSNTGKTWGDGEHYKVANELNDPSGSKGWKVDFFLFFGLRKWKDAGSKTPRAAKAPQQGATVADMLASLPAWIREHMSVADSAAMFEQGATDCANAAKILRALAKTPVQAAGGEPAAETTEQAA